MKKHLMVIASLLMAIFLLARCGHKPPVQTPDEYTRDRVVLLKGDGGSCSGVIIEAPSHLHYILTAAHCTAVDSKRNIIAVTEDEREFPVHIVEISMWTDLMLLDSPEIDALDPIKISEHIERHGKVHTMTHGQGFPSYRTDGEIMGETMTGSFFDPTMPPYIQLASTCLVLHGSSGGPLFNEKEELVGIVSRGDGVLGYFVTLDDIHRFLVNR